MADIMPYSVQGGESSIADFNELKTGGLWSITSETNRPDPLYKYWEVNVTVGKDGTVLQQAKVKAGGNSGIYSRMYRPAEKDWTSWTQQFGYNSLADLSTGVANQIGNYDKIIHRIGNSGLGNYTYKIGKFNATTVSTLFSGILSISRAESQLPSIYTISLSKNRTSTAVRTKSTLIHSGQSTATLYYRFEGNGLEFFIKSSANFIAASMLILEGRGELELLNQAIDEIPSDAVEFNS